MEGKEQKQKKRDALSDGVIQELVAPKITFQAADVKTVGVFQAIYPCQLDREANFITSVLGSVSINCLISSQWRRLDWR